MYCLYICWSYVSVFETIRISVYTYRLGYCALYHSDAYVSDYCHKFRMKYITPYALLLYPSLPYHPSIFLYLLFQVMKMLLLVVALFACSWSPKLIIDMIMARAVTDVEEDPPFDKMNFTQHQWPMGNSTPQMAFGPFGNGSSEGMFNYEDEQTRLEQARAYAISLMLFHSTFNPIVYIAFSSDFRAALCQRRRRMRI